MRPRRRDSPGPYRRAEAEELYKTGARGGVQQEVRQRVQQEDGAEEEQGEEKEERRKGEEEQTDKIREPLTEVREKCKKKTSKTYKRMKFIGSFGILAL